MPACTVIARWGYWLDFTVVEGLGTSRPPLARFTPYGPRLVGRSLHAQLPRCKACVQDPRGAQIEPGRTTQPCGCLLVPQHDPHLGNYQADTKDC